MRPIGWFPFVRAFKTAKVVKKHCIFFFLIPPPHSASVLSVFKVAKVVNKPKSSEGRKKKKIHVFFF